MMKVYVSSRWFSTGNPIGFNVVKKKTVVLVVAGFSLFPRMLKK